MDSSSEVPSSPRPGRRRARRIAYGLCSLAIVLVVAQLFLRLFAPQHKGAIDPTLPSRKLNELLPARGADYLDMLPILAEEDPDALYFAFDGHFQPFGYAECGTAIIQRWPAIVGS